MHRFRSFLKKNFPVSVKGWLILFVSAAIAFVLCSVMSKAARSDIQAGLIFVLNVLLVSMFTEGYLYGILAAFISVFAVNIVFTYPYMELNFFIYGYPLTFITMLGVGIAVSALTTRIKEQEKMQLEAENEKVRANLLRSISHDLRTPLTSISGSVSLLLDEHSSFSRKQQDQLLTDIKNETDWLYRMVENILTITRIENETQQSITKQPELLEEVISEAVLKFKKRNPEIHVHVAPSEEIIFVNVDPLLIEQVLINLLDNAVIHGKTTTDIQINYQTIHNHIRVSVCDNGEGIQSGFLEDIRNQHFNRYSNLQSDKSRHMGIGLMLCRTIIEAHNGHFNIQNIPEGGCMASFTLEYEKSSFKEE